MSIRSTLGKIAAVSLVDALGIYVVFTLGLAGEWPIAIAVGLATLALNWVYLGHRAVPAKYLAPGFILLVVFQLFVIVYTFYIAFTNYGVGHLTNKQDAIAAIEVQSQQRVPDSPVYRLTILDGAGVLAVLVTEPSGDVLLGDATTPLAPVQGATLNDVGTAVGLPGYTALTFKEVLARQAEILAMAVPISADPTDGQLKTQDGRTAYVYRPVLVYDPALDAMVDQATGAVYPDNGRGSFARPGEPPLTPGWRALIGIDNFQKIVIESMANGQLLGVFAWTFAFAILSVGTAFAMGMFLALVFNDPRLRGRRLYRVLLILPYGFPAFISILVWGGMFNQQFGFINQTLLGGARIAWLEDPLLAKFALLLVNMWLEFPYFFLVATGALQSIPVEVEEAAVLDGASRWGLFRFVRFPLLLVSLAALLISAFSFAINNYTLVWLLTQGRPIPIGSSYGVGQTDILITVVYKIAFGSFAGGNSADYGLASAYSVVIFMVVGVIAIFSFRRTKQLEEIF